jgi:hypothetical protein
MAEDAESIPSLEMLNHDLLIETRNRGRVWRYVMPAGFDAKTGAIRVNFLAPPKPAAPAADAAAEAPPAAAPAPAPAAPINAGIKADSVVYVFEDGPPKPPAPNGMPQSPVYLGEFRVLQAAPQQALIQPVQPLDPTDYEFKRLTTSKGPWVIYETMPMDRYENFAGLKEEQLKQMLPKRSVDEFLRHGKEATNDDDPFRKVGFDAEGKQLPPEEIGKAAKVVYQRRLRDYAAEFDELNRRRIALKTEKEAVEKDIAKLVAAQEVATKLQAFRTEEKAKLTKDLAGITKEREAIEKHLAQVNQLLEKARQLTAGLMAENRKLVAELARRQLGSSPPGQGNAPALKVPASLALGNVR